MPLCSVEVHNRTTPPSLRHFKTRARVECPLAGERCPRGFSTYLAYRVAFSVEVIPSRVVPNPNIFLRPYGASVASNQIRFPRSIEKGQGKAWISPWSQQLKSLPAGNNSRE